MQLRHALGDKVGVAQSLAGMASIARALGQPGRAARWLGTAEAVHEAVGHGLHPAERAELDRDASALRAQLGEAAFLEARERGRAAAVDAAMDEAHAMQSDRR